MARVMMTCRVCGKEYEACRSANVGAFRWQEVACSPECGAEYLRRINESRSVAQVTPTPAKKERHRKIIEQEPESLAENIPVNTETKDDEKATPD